MKSMTLKFTAAAAALFTLIGALPEARATDVKLEGTGFYKLATKIKYDKGGAKQSGRYGNLGADYYHKATYGMRWIINHSSNKSGSLSFEFWAMPYYGATKGIVLMTRGLNRLSGYDYYSKKSPSGRAVFVDDTRFPELNLWEYSGNGWVFRDALSFKDSTRL